MNISIHLLPIMFLVLVALLTYFCHYVLKDKFHTSFFGLITFLTFIVNIIWYGILFIIWTKENITITY